MKKSSLLYKVYLITKYIAVNAFRPLKNRAINSVLDEVTRTDRREFDTTIIKCFGLDENLLDSLYNILITSVSDRVSMSEK